MPEPKTRPTGATAELGRIGFPHIITPTGGTLDIVTGASHPGFNPLDLLYASLAGCQAMSARIAAHRLGVLDRIRDIDAKTKEAIMRAAEEICTVSNTIAGAVRLNLRMAE